MRPSPFRYCRPVTLADALIAMQAGAVPLAGGQSLIQALRLREAEPSAIVDLNAIAEFTTAIVSSSDGVRIGALTTHAQLAEQPLVREEFPWLAEAATALGDVQVRSRGTVLGNVCWGDPRANMAVALLAADAVVHCADPHEPAKPHSIPLNEFFTGFRRTALGSRLAIALSLPRSSPRRRGAYLEFSRQRQDLALCNVCVVVGPAAERYARVVVGGIYDRPVRLLEVEELLAAHGPQAQRLEASIASAFSQMTLTPYKDQFASVEYKQQLAKVLFRRALAVVDGERAHA